MSKNVYSSGVAAEEIYLVSVLEVYLPETQTRLNNKKQLP